MSTMRITWKPTTDAPPQFPDECADCGEWMNSKTIGKDRQARCVACHIIYIKGA